VLLLGAGGAAGYYEFTAKGDLDKAILLAREKANQLAFAKNEDARRHCEQFG